MEMQQLTYFLAAAQTQNFRRAAEQCLVAQSALSRQIAALEHELDTPLFARVRQRVVLTTAGYAFAAYVRGALDQLQEGQQWMAELHAGERGTVRLGCIESLATAVLPHLFARFHAQHPQIDLKVLVNHTDEIASAVEQGTIDLGLILDPHQQSQLLVTRELFRQPLHLLVSVQHPFAQSGLTAVTLPQLATEPLIILDATSRMGQITHRVFAHHHLPLHPLVEIESVEGLKELVRHNLGVTLTLPALIRPAQIGTELVLLPIRDLTEEYVFALVYRRVGGVSAAARAFIKAIAPPEAAPLD